MSAVGAYEGARYYTYGLYRPTLNSKMRALGQPFNAVSREKIIRDIYALVDPLDAWRPNASPIAETDPALWVDVVDPDVILVEWKVDGTVVPGASGESFRLADFGVAAGTYTITARAYDPTDWVRIDRSQLEQSVSWTVTVVDAGSLDADGNGTAEPLTDGILILRYLLDPAGTWSVADALGAGATRTTPAAISAYLGGLTWTMLDVDGNGGAAPLSDGLLILRYLFDPAGQWRTDDAVEAGATRTTREEIRSHLDQFHLGLPAETTLAPQIARDAVLEAWLDG